MKPVLDAGFQTIFKGILLQVLSGHADIMLSKTDRDDPLSRRAETIKEQVERMAQTTYKLMNITRYKTKDYQKEKIFDIEKSLES